MNQYWTLFYYGSSLMICSRHTTHRAAQRAVRACEKRGGAPHIIIHAVQVPLGRR